MDDKKLQETFRRAAEIASVVPESMHQAAFNRALDALMGATQPSHQPSSSGGGTSGTPAREPAKLTNVDDRVTALMAMERSRAPEVDSAEGALGKALALLLVARRELAIDGLTSPEIATVLTDKFRWRVSRQAINQALDTAGNQVDRTKDGRASRWRIMQAGETWLATPAGGPQNSSKSRSATGTRRRKKTKRANSAEGTAGDQTKQTTTKAGTSSSGRRASLGPKGAVEKLIDAGWFAAPRSLADIRVELEHQQALRYKPTDLSPTMVRLLREGRLKRTKTEAGQYEYRA